MTMPSRMILERQLDFAARTMGVHEHGGVQSWPAVRVGKYPRRLKSSHMACFISAMRCESAAECD